MIPRLSFKSMKLVLGATLLLSIAVLASAGEIAVSSPSASPPLPLNTTRTGTEALQTHTRPDETKEGYVSSVGSALFASLFPLATLRSLYLTSPPSISITPDLKAYIYSPNLKTYPNVLYLGQGSKRVLVTGGAGFVGSHLVDRLMMMGHQVLHC